LSELILIAAITAYLIGSIPFGLLFARWLTGKDPRSHGSGNIGATNVMRTGGRRVGLLTLLADILKGTIPVAIAIMFDSEQLLVAIVALAVFIGHIFPLYLRFKGGKGVATMFGVVIPWMPWVAVGSFAVWLIVFWSTRYVSLASIIAGVALPMLAWLLGASVEATVVCLVLGGLMTARHYSNIGRLWAGIEPKTGAS
jgi:glycerol-3-phosphate acyltransferase PlsY